jgi:hypothetical protein
MRRREFITLLGGAAAVWPIVVRAQQPLLPVVGFINGGSADGRPRDAAAFRKGLNETGYVEGQNITVEYHWLEGHYDRLPALLADPFVDMHNRMKEALVLLGKLPRAVVRPPLVKLERAEMVRIRAALVEAGLLGKAAGRDAA